MGGVTMANDWSVIFEMRVDDHVHLDLCVESPPAPGDAHWIVIADELVDQLVAHGGAWIVVLPVGVVRDPLAGRASVASLFDLADSRLLTAPPAAHRLSAERVEDRWEGEFHEWRRPVRPSVVEVINVLLDPESADGGDVKFDAQVLYEIGPTR